MTPKAVVTYVGASGYREISHRDCLKKLTQTVFLRHYVNQVWMLNCGN